MRKHKKVGEIALNWTHSLLAVGHFYLPQLSRSVARCLVSPHNQFLCTALGILSGLCYEALGGQERRSDVIRAGAMLSLLTKVDDQVIDDRNFHGCRELLAEKTRAYLAPTLAAIIERRAADGSPRCLLAAQLGQLLGELGDERRLERLLQLIAYGWEVQVRAVVTLSSPPGRVEMAQVAKVTAEISGAWLLMIAAIGTLPGDARRMLHTEEEQAFFDWGFHIQRADALADFAKDIGDGLISSYPGYLLYHQHQRYLDLCKKRDFPELYRWLRRSEVDITSLPRDLPQLPELGQVSSLLHWIHGFLTWRYLCHPHCRRPADSPAFAPFVEEHRSYDHYLRSVSRYLDENKSLFQ